ncbi:MAG TPA: HEAT repeat domain-containing protein, partial [Planctomycetota bacterium]|nr:HEAT repeat domain-containing protein [Planctomycetota bacterium]
AFGAAAEPAVLKATRARAPSFADAEAVLARLSATEATQRLAAAWIAGDGSDATLEALAARPDALAVARAEAARVDGDLRFRAACLVARLGGAEAASTAADGLRRPDRRREAATALLTLGTREALIETARLVDGFDGFAGDGALREHVDLVAAARSVPDVGRRAAAAAARTGRTSDRRRLLILAGLSKDAAARPEIERAAADPEVRAAAFVALGELGDPDAAPFLARAVLRTHDRSTRRSGVDALARLPGPKATAALASLLASSADRDRAAARLEARPDGPEALVDALNDPATRAPAAAALRELAGRSAPRGDDAAAWRRWLAGADR